MNLQPIILTTNPSQDYELIDSGEGEKLERFGAVVVRRPDPQALWTKSLPPKDWSAAQAVFSKKAKSGWEFPHPVEKKWAIELAALKFWIRPSTFKHVGIFPEQQPQWDWLRTTIKEAITKDHREEVKVLNLFGYTGGATLACAQAGAKVVHLDGSKVAIKWARENAQLSGLETKPVRWILDDARAFLKREIKRQQRYDGIIMDPPAFGHGPDGELWKIEDHFLDLMKLCFDSLSEAPLFVLINGYASGYSSLAYKHNLDALEKRFGGTITYGELTIAPSHSTRLLPAGIFARWSA